MSELYLPQKTVREIANAQAATKFYEHTRACEWFDREIKAFDDRLSLVWLNENAPPPPGTKPGYWHVKRINENAADDYHPITGPGGEFTEPTGRHLEQLKHKDMWNGGLKRLRDAQAHQQKVRESKQADSRRDFREEAATVIKTLNAPWVRIPRDI